MPSSRSTKRDVADGTGPVRTHDVMGTRRIFDWLDANQRVEVVDNAVCADVREIARVPRLVSINSAVEVDLHGNANAEVPGWEQISGLGGGPDFTEGADALRTGSASSLCRRQRKGAGSSGSSRG